MKDSKDRPGYSAEAVFSRVMEVLFLVPIFVITTAFSKVFNKIRRKT